LGFFSVTFPRGMPGTSSINSSPGRENSRRLMLSICLNSSCRPAVGIWQSLPTSAVDMMFAPTLTSGARRSSMAMVKPGRSRRRMSFRISSLSAAMSLKAPARARIISEARSWSSDWDRTLTHVRNASLWGFCFVASVSSGPSFAAPRHTKRL